MVKLQKPMFAVIATAAIALSSATVKASNDPIPLYQNSHSIKTLIQSEQAENVNDWKVFTNKYGSWNVTIDKAIGTPTIAFGKPIKIIEAAKMDSASILAAVKIFLNENKNIFKVNTEQLKLKRIELVQNKWYVTFGQVFEDYDVMFSEIQFTINMWGEVFAFKISFYDNIKLPITDKISTDEILATVSNSFNTNPNFDKKETNSFQSGIEDKQYIIPIYKNNTVSYHLVKQVNTINKNGMRLYETYVDAHSGDILWQKSCLMNFEAKIKMKVKTYDKYNFEPEEIFPLPKAKILVNGVEKTLDNNGEITITEPVSEVKFNFNSDLTQIYFAKAGPNIPQYQDKAETVTFPITEGENELLLYENNSNKYERFAIHHINVAKQKILEIDNSLKCLNKKLPISFYKSFEYLNSPNAFYSSNDAAFGFVHYLQDTLLMATCPAVMYHEYGHAINDLFYKERKAEFNNGACHEALADVNANMILDDPIGTQKIFINKPDEYIRNSDNNAIYPDSMNGEPHNDGLILAGAFWDLRKLTSRETAYRLSHFARYELPDDIDIGTAFHEWFIATLVADDDDGDLTNGTPNFNEICEAFNKHNIGINLFVSRNINFIPPKDIKNCQIPQKFEVTINNVNNFIIHVKLPETFTVVYSIDCFETTNRATLYKNGNKYIGEVPKFDEPCTVRYYLEYIDANSNQISTVTQNREGWTWDFVYNTGYYTIWKEDFENNPKYKIETNFYDDIYGRGEGWEIEKPIGVLNDYGYAYQPDFDMTDGNGKCLVTGSGQETTGQFYPPKGELQNGRSIATSPEYKIPKVNGKLYLTFWLLEDNSFYWDTVKKDPANSFYFMYKTDKMNEWDTLHKMFKGYTNELPTKGSEYYNTMLHIWKKCLYKLPDEVLDADKITLKFYAGSRLRYGNTTYYCHINILVDDIELLTDDSTVSKITEESENNFSIISNPNPFTSETNILITSAFQQNISGKLIDINGKIIAAFENLFINEGETVIPLTNICKQNLITGAYILTVTANGKNYICKLIKK